MHCVSDSFAHHILPSLLVILLVDQDLMLPEDLPGRQDGKPCGQSGVGKASREGWHYSFDAVGILSIDR
jgi:hypothetical protein